MGLKDKKPHKVTADAFKYKYVIAGRPKVGKTSLVYEITKEKFGGDLSKLLLVAFEKGYNALDGIYAEDINDWQGFKKLVDELVRDKDELPFEILAFDTADVMSKYATEYVLRMQSNKDSKLYSAMADLAYGKGYDLLDAELTREIARLEKAGYTLIFITHDKDKQFETREGLKYDKTTLSLGGRVRDTLINMVDFIVFIEITKIMVKGKQVDKREIYFRGESGLEAGSRFKHVPNKIDYDAKLFIETVEDAILAEYGGSTEEVEKAKKEQNAEFDKKAKDFVETVKQDDDNDLDAILEEINNEIKTMKKTDKLKLVSYTESKYDLSHFKDITDAKDMRDVLNYIVTELKK